MPTTPRIHRPRVAHHRPRVTDGQRHPVTVRRIVRTQEG